MTEIEQVDPAAVDYDYQIAWDKVKITKYTGCDRELTVPGVIDGMPVVRICDSAFAYCATLQKVFIPDGVTIIESGTFEGCISLVSVHIPASVEEIDPFAFSACFKLSEIKVDGGNAAYSDVDGVLYDKAQTVLCHYPGSRKGVYEIPQGVIKIYHWAFRNCKNLTGLVFPDSLIEFDMEAFSGFDSLESIGVDPLNPKFSSLDGVLFDKSRSTLIEYPRGKIGDYVIPCDVKSLGERGFAHCKNLTSVVIHSGVASIGDYTFHNCPRLNEISVEPDNKFYSSCDGILFDKNCSTLIKYPSSKTGCYNVPAGVTCIRDGAFYDCASLFEVIIHEGVISIGEDAFHGCAGLVSVTIPGGISRISACMFADCKCLDDVVIPDSVTSIGMQAFCGCRSLTSITIPENVMVIELQAFRDCINLTNVIIRTGVKIILDDAFSGCVNLTSITIPASVTNLGKDVFKTCTQLKIVCFEGNAPVVESDLFSNFPNVTVYYLPGTTGWGETFSGKPTAVWEQYEQEEQE